MSRFTLLIMLLVLLVTGSAVAVESGPSAPIGFFTITVSRPPAVNGYNLISFPVLPNDATIQNVIGGQIPRQYGSTSGSLLQHFNNGTGLFQIAFRNQTATGWGGAFTHLESHKGYYLLLRNNTPELSYDIVVAGKVRTTTWDMGTIGVGYNMVGSVFSAPTLLANTNLVTGTTRFIGGFPVIRSDLVQGFSNNTFQTGWFNSQTQSWTGELTALEPGKGYWILRRAGRTPANFTWNNLPVPTPGTDSFIETVTPAPAPKLSPTDKITVPATKLSPTDAASAPVSSKPSDQPLLPKSK